MKNAAQKIRVALAGNANVGKSVIFNHLTGLHQHIGNWPGKTIERAEGSVFFKGYEIEIIDLPGIYSLSTYSLEEIVSRKYILCEKPDIIINIVDGGILERNLFFTLQLMELSAPMIMVINQIDMAQNKGVIIDFNKLVELLGIPVIPMIATKGRGFAKLLNNIINIYEGKKQAIPKCIRYGQELETQIDQLQYVLREKNILPQYPQRWLTLKIFEEDEEIIKELQELYNEPSYNIDSNNKRHPQDKNILTLSRSIITRLEELHGHSCSNLISSERYHAINCIINQVQRFQKRKKPLIRERLDLILLHPILGYLFLFGTVFIILYSIFVIGEQVSGIMFDLFTSLRDGYEDLLGTDILAELLWSGLEGIAG